MIGVNYDIKNKKCLFIELRVDLMGGERSSYFQIYMNNLIFYMVASIVFVMDIINSSFFWRRRIKYFNIIVVILVHFHEYIFLSNKTKNI